MNHLITKERKFRQMGLFDVFTFKKEAVKVFSKENIVATLNLAKEKIVEKAQEAIAGNEKKEIVDKIVIDFIKEKAKVTNNKVVLWFVDKVIEIIPSITQTVYDFLKERIENL